jgi:TolB-like protein
MKRNRLVFFLLIAVVGSAFAQRAPVVCVTQFEASGTSVTDNDAANITSQVISELLSWGSLEVVRDEASANYIVRGTLSRQGNVFVLTAQTFDARSGRRLSESREQAAVIADISIFTFCTKVVEEIPLPNYLLGTWQSTLNLPDGPVVCIIEFKSDRTVSVERYDTWEHRQNNALRYEGYGTGTYSYAGYFTRRTVTVNSQQVQVDATANINLRLEETLPEQTTVNQSRLNLVFNGDRNYFEIAGGALPCGRNYDGPSVYPSAVLGFSQFTKIR